MEIQTEKAAPGKKSMCILCKKEEFSAQHLYNCAENPTKLKVENMHTKAEEHARFIAATVRIARLTKRREAAVERHKRYREMMRGKRTPVNTLITPTNTASCIPQIY